MRLSELAAGSAITMAPDGDWQEIEVCGLTADSRSAAPGYLFAAIPGGRADGRAFIGEAVERGAVAVLAPTGTSLPPSPRPIALITDDNPRRRLALLAARFHGRQPRVIAAVTGTSGKTSVAAFTRQIWEHLGHKAASLGTLGLEPSIAEGPGSLTTPDPVALHRCLAAVADRGVDHLAMEASSHGLDQYRLDGIQVAAAAFTNLSRDHLDYHPDMGAYLAAKVRLFAELLSPDGAAVLNADVSEFDTLLQTCRRRSVRVISYGQAGHDLRLLSTAASGEGQSLALDLFGRRHEVRLPLAGTFQSANALAALGLATATGASAEEALAALPSLVGVRGRLELVATTPRGGRVYVDYAHKPGALEAALTALRPHTARRLVVAFGCGGDRDPGKRPIMGEIASRLADLVIVTDDNPRDEDPSLIRKEILAAAPRATEIGDRGTAIATAMAELGPGDVLVIAGKGHEAGQIVGGRTLPFDDRSVARAALSSLPGARS